MAGTADLAFGWETDASLVRKKYYDLKVVMSSDTLRMFPRQTIMQLVGLRTQVPEQDQLNAIFALAAAAARQRTAFGGSLT